MIRSVFNLSKSLAEFAAEAAKKIKFIFSEGVYLEKNTSRSESVEFCLQEANKLCTAQTAALCRKPPKEFFDSQ